MNPSVSGWQPGTSWYGAAAAVDDPSSVHRSTVSAQAFWDARPDYEKLNQILGLGARDLERLHGREERRGPLDKAETSQLELRNGVESLNALPNVRADNIPLSCLASSSYTSSISSSSNSSGRLPLHDLSNDVASLNHRLHSRQALGAKRAFRRSISVQDSPSEASPGLRTSVSMVPEGGAAPSPRSKRTRTESLDSLIARVSHSLERTEERPRSCSGPKKGRKIKVAVNVDSNLPTDASSKLSTREACHAQGVEDRRQIPRLDQAPLTRPFKPGLPGDAQNTSQLAQTEKRTTGSDSDSDLDDMILSEELIAVLSQYDKPS